MVPRTIDNNDEGVAYIIYSDRESVDAVALQSILEYKNVTPLKGRQPYFPVTEPPFPALCDKKENVGCIILLAIGLAWVDPDPIVGLATTPSEYIDSAAVEAYYPDKSIKDLPTNTKLFFLKH